jgi:hypothetical protein
MSRRLALAVIAQAVEDRVNPLFIKYPYERPYWKENAKRFLEADWGHENIFEGWCRWADINPTYVQRKVL